MARVPGHLNAASLGQRVMISTVQCPECGVVLNVPDSAAGRKLKCPKCATKFAAPSASSIGPADSAIADSSPASTMFPTRKGPSSSGGIDLPTRRGSSGDIDLPSAMDALIFAMADDVALGPGARDHLLHVAAADLFQRFAGQHMDVPGLRVHRRRRTLGAFDDRLDHREIGRAHV